MTMTRCTILSLLLFLTFSTISLAQTNPDYSAYIDQALVEIEEAEQKDSLQNKYASEFYEFYLSHKNTDTGQKAIEQAIRFWASVGNADMMDEFMLTLEPESELWSKAVNFLHFAYQAEESNRTISDYVDTLYSKKSFVTNPEGKSDILLFLARSHLMILDEKEKAIQVAQELVNLNVSEWYVNQGLLIITRSSLTIGDKSPDFEIVNSQNQTIKLSDFKGKYVLLDFWATWCSPCLEDIPTIRSIDDKYSEQELVILGIALEENSEGFQSFLEKNGINWPQINSTEEVPNKFGVYGVPQIYIIDPDGDIVAKNLRGDKLVAKIDTLINGR